MWQDLEGDETCWKLDDARKIHCGIVFAYDCWKPRYRQNIINFEKDVYTVATNVGQRKTSESPKGVEAMALCTPIAQTTHLQDIEIYGKAGV